MFSRWFGQRPIGGRWRADVVAEGWSKEIRTPLRDFDLFGFAARLVGVLAEQSALGDQLVEAAVDALDVGGCLP